MTPLHCRLLAASDDPAWDALWESSASRWLPQCPAFLRAFLPADHRRVAGVFDDSGRLVMALPFAVERGRWMTSWRTPPMGAFCGPLVDRGGEEPRPRERFQREVLEALARGGVVNAALADLVAPPGWTDLRGLGWSGWDLRPHYNYLTRWEADGAWEQALKPDFRRKLRKADREGVVVEFGGAELMAGLGPLWAETARRAGLDAGLQRAVVPAAEWLSASGAGFVAVARAGSGGGPLAAALVGHDAGRVYYLAGASTPAGGAGAEAPSLLHARLLGEIETRGLPRCYDWVGANTPSVCQFKRQFGPEVEILAAARWISPGMRVALALRRWGRMG